MTKCPQLHTKRTRQNSGVSSSTQNLTDASNSDTDQTQSWQDDTVGVRQDPASKLLPEIFTEVYKYCSNSDLCRFRLVSSSWKNSVEEIWRKRVTIYIYKDNTVGSKRTSSLTDFSAAIQKQEFDFSKWPLRRFKFYKFEFILRNYNARSIMGGLLSLCGPTVSHLGISDCIIEDGRQFSVHFLSKFCNIKTLNITRLIEHPQKFEKKTSNSNRGNRTENIVLPVFGNLSHLKIDYSGFGYKYTNSTKLFQPPWLILFSSTPNLETLEIFYGKEFGGPIGFTIIDVLRPVELLSLENKLKKLTHIHICNDIMGLDTNFYDTFKQCLVEQSEALQRSSIALKSLKFDVKINSLDPDLIHRWRAADGNEFIETLLQRFGGRDLQYFECCPWKPDYPQFPPAIKGMCLENLTHLSLNSMLGKTTKSAEQMPKLKSLVIWSYLPHTREPKKLERNKKYLHYLPKDQIVAELADDEDCHSEDPDYYPGDMLPNNRQTNFVVRQPKTSNICIPAVNNDYKPIFWEIPNPDASIGFQFKFLRHFRFEIESWLPQKFYSLSTWMPNLTSLEIPLTASDFTVVCDQLRSLQRLVILYTPNNYESISFSPIDDCAITGKRHTSNTLFVCSCNNFVPRHRRKQSVNWSYFCDIGQPAVKPNITYLQELRHFEMEGLKMSINLDIKFRTVAPLNKETGFICGFHRTYNQHIYLTDESVFDGFYKLPKLTYLNVSAKLSNYTRKQLFKRIQKCILIWPVQDDSARLYNTMQNFEPNNVV